PTMPSRCPAGTSRLTSRTACTTGAGPVSVRRGRRNSRFSERRLMAGVAVGVIGSVAGAILTSCGVVAGEAICRLAGRVVTAGGPRGQLRAHLGRVLAPVAEHAAAGEAPGRRHRPGDGA